jgi:integrase
MARHILTSNRDLKERVDAALVQAAQRKTRVRVNDGGGLRVEVTPAGSTSWQVLFTMPGRPERPYTLGKYPELPLKLVRQLADQVHEKVARGIDPNDEKQALRAGQAAQAEAIQGDTVDKVWETYLENTETRDKHGKVIKALSQRSLTTMQRTYAYNVQKHIGTQVAKTVTPQQIESLLRQIEARGAHETRRRMAGWLASAFREALIQPNPVDAVDHKAFKRPVSSPTGHAGTTEPRVLAQVLRTVAAFEGSALSRAAIMLHARLFMRPDELRLANWDQVRGDMFEAKVVLENQKFAHLVPLSAQAQALFKTIHGMHPTYVVPGTRYGQRMSDSTLGRIMHALGWKDVQTVHGFRKSASTLLNEMGWDHRIVDMQLSHLLNGPGSEGRYNQAKYLQQRIPMMQCWSDYIDALLDPNSGADTMLPLRWRERWEDQRLEAPDRPGRTHARAGTLRRRNSRLHTLGESVFEPSVPPLTSSA